MPKTRPTFRPAIRYTDPATGKEVIKSGNQWYDIHATLFEDIPDEALRKKLIDADAEYWKFTGKGNKPDSPAGFVDEHNNFYSRDQAKEIVEYFEGAKFIPEYELTAEDLIEGLDL